MGHVHLIRLPSTKAWNAVVDLLVTGASESSIIGQSARAAEKSFRILPQDPVYSEALQLLITIPKAAATQDFAGNLGAHGIAVSTPPHVLDLVVGMGTRLDAVAQASGRPSDLSELVHRSALGTLTRMIGDSLPGLFAADSIDVQQAASRLATPAGFRDLSRSFHTALSMEVLSYWLDRTLATQVGNGKRFETVADRSSFDAALEQYCTEATRIIAEFSAGWYAKNILGWDEILPSRVAGYGAIAVRKITEELQRKHGIDA